MLFYAALSAQWGAIVISRAFRCCAQGRKLIYYPVLQRTAEKEGTKDETRTDAVARCGNAPSDFTAYLVREKTFRDRLNEQIGQMKLADDARDQYFLQEVCSMASVYDRTDIYDLFDSTRKDEMTKAHWESVLSGIPVRTALDVSIGTGSLTLPLAELGISLYGSDLSEAMLDRCRKKAAERGLSVDLRQCDFRALRAHFEQKFDCVMSTGNSLAYVPNDELTDVLSQMDSLVAPGGALYFDLRNWDKIVQQEQRFYFYDPAFLPDGDRVNLMQVWDHHGDSSITFHLLYTFERGGKIFQKEHFEEHYYPVAQKLLLDQLARLGYEDIRVRAFPVQFGAFDPERSNWYCVLARKAK